MMLYEYIRGGDEMTLSRSHSRKIIRRRRAARWRKWLLISTVSLVVLLGAGYIGLNMAVDYVLRSFLGGAAEDEQVLAMLEGDLGALFDEGSIDLNGLAGEGLASVAFDRIGDSTTTNNGQAAGGAVTSSRDEGRVIAEGTISPVPPDRNRGTDLTVPTERSGDAKSPSGNSSSMPVESRDPSAPTAGTDAPSSSGKQAIEPTPASIGQVEGAPAASDDPLSYTPEVTKEKAAAVQESITLGEKLKVAGVLMKRLDASDIDLFMKMMSGGMTVEEKRSAKDIMLERLTAEEYDELIQIAAKYGLSRGKSYEESLLE